MIATIAEFTGTFFFLLMSYLCVQTASTQTNVVGDTSAKVLYSSLGFGMSLLVNVAIFGRISGAHFNPAVTLGAVLAGAIHPIRAAMYIGAQFLGAMIAGAFALALMPGHLEIVTTLSAGTTIAQGLFIEFFATAQLVFAILWMAVEVR
jgi:aquaporin related protein